ncbi:O-antigen ligase family protein, partial [candidate division WWE3 bacterium]|nr:O-antigen ligase family protein [candidate division WWE3 bacterium]
MVNELITTLSPPGKREQQWLAVFLISIIIFFVLLERSIGLQTSQTMIGIFIGITIVLFAIRSRIEIERTIFVAIFLFIFMGVLSVSSSTVMEESLFSLIHYIGIFLVFVLAFSITMKQELFLEWLANILLLFGTGYVGYYLIGGFSSGSFLSGQKLIGTFTWHNQMAAFILYLIPIALGFAWKYRDDRRGWIFSAIAVLHAIALVLTYSRGAWLSAVAAGIIALLLGVRVASFSKRSVMVSIGVFIFLAVLLLQIPALKERASLVLAEFSSSTRSISGELRLTSIQSAWEMVNDYPVTGVGIGAYGAANYMYQSQP